MSESTYWTRRLGRRTVLRGAAIGAGSLGILGGLACSSNNKNIAASATIAAAGGSPVAGAARSGSPVAAGSAPAATIKRGGTINLMADADPPHLDFHRTVSTPVAQWCTLVYNRLLRYRQGPDVDPNAFEIEPDLATAMPEQPDPLTYVFKLPAGVKFHNKAPVNGRELTADDVRTSFERQGTKKPDFVFGYLVDAIEKIETPDPLTVRITIARPTASFLSAMAYFNTAIAPKEQLADQNLMEKGMIGTGPFVFQEFQSKVASKFARNPDYYRKGLPYLDGVTISIITDNAARLAAFRSQQSDVTVGDELSQELVTALKQSNPNVRVEEFSEAEGYHLMLQQKPPYNDLRVRQALSAGIDRNALIDRLLSGKGELRTSPIPLGLKQWARPQAQIEAEAKRDVQKAKQLLAAAGHASDISLDVSVSNIREFSKAIMQVMQEQLKEIGVTLNVKVIEQALYLKQEPEHSFDAQSYVIRPYPDPDDLIYPLFYSKGSKNYGQINDPELDALIVKQREALDKNARKTALQDLDSKWDKFQYHVYPLVRTYFMAYQNYVKIYRARNPAEFTRVQETWLDK
jgi:peptide/nickel transport system substrate-binding protein